MAGGDKKKKKKRSDRSRSRSPRRSDRSPRRRKSSPESGSDSEPERQSRRDKDRDRSKDKKKEKDYYKSLETPEEKRARRLAKKEAKDKKRRKQMGWNNEYEGYTNTDNPFGDAHFLETFVWRKKQDNHGEEDLDEDGKRVDDKKKHMERRKQLESVRQRRAEREREMVLREEEKERMQRDKESNYYSEWEKQEDKFHLEQATLRSKIRIQDGRAKPIDLLAQYISIEDEDLDIQMHEPYTILVGLTQGDLSDLLEDIKVYMELEQGKNTEYWQDITIVCKDELQKLKRQVHDDQLSRREGIHSAAHNDVAATFKGKTYSQLIVLEKRIYSKISSGEAVDIGFWESLLQQLKMFMAKARLKERHQKMLREKLMQLKQQKEETTESTGEIELSESDSEPEEVEVEKETLEEPAEEVEGKQDDEEPSTSKNWRDESDDDNNETTESTPAEDATVPLFTEEDLLEESYMTYKAGNYSPKLIKTADVEEHLIMDVDEDWQKLIALRQDVNDSGSVLIKALESSSREEQEEARKGLGPDEETFNVTVPLSKKTYSWEDKYRPRKPRFFNRVHTGYEWNKYNQTHYDSDNPPPKIVQGYKFNIFYPDLIEKTVAPEYHLEPASDSQEFGILRFHAGPPYEDIAFKIVNREWEYSHRKGFRCQFHNNIFQLWFHFKRYRYRR